MNRRRTLFCTLLLATASVACAPSPATERANENLMATLWVRHAAEYGAAARTVYGAAAARLDAALEDRTWTAAIEQVGADFADLPPAIVLDVDETVLDNVDYQARLILEGDYYGSETWTAWCEERSARPVPGSLAFLRAADARGVAIFYVTNRKAHVDAATVDNLRALGYPVVDEHVMTRGEREEWTSDKTSRRAHVAATHRIVMMFGDNLGDFVDIEELGVDERAERVAKGDAWWGQRWFMLPNPMYGSWDAALIDGEWSLPPEERVARKRAWLERAVD